MHVIKTSSAGLIVLLLWQHPILAGPIFSSLSSRVPRPSTRSQGRLDVLEKQLRESLARRNNDPDLLHRLGTVLSRQGKTQEARDLWDKAATVEPNLPPADVKRVYELIRTGSLGAAKSLLQRTRERIPNNPHVHLAQGEFAVRKQQNDAAERAFRKAHELAPGLFATNFSLGRFLDFVGTKSAAERYYVAATTASPARPEGWIARAAIHFRKDEIPQTLEMLRNAEKADPKGGLAETRLARIYLGIKDFVGALQWYGAALHRSPNDTDLQLALGEVQLRLSLKERARKQFEAVLGEQENLAALLFLAQMEQFEGKSEEAEAYYRRALKLDPHNAVANNNLAMLLMQMDRAPQEALNLAKTAMQLLPGTPAINGTYGCVLFQAGQRDKAKKILARAVRQTPLDPWVRYAYAKLLHMELEPERARVHLKGCLILDPDFPRKSEILQLLSE